MEWVYNDRTERAVDLSEIKKRSANATTWLTQKLEQEKQVDRDIKNKKNRLTDIKNSTIMGSVYGICEGDKDAYLCGKNSRLGESFRCYKKNAQFVCGNRPLSLC